MVGLIIFVTLVVLIVVSVKKRGKTKHVTELKSINTPYTTEYWSATYSTPIQETTDGWCLNPGTPFELTVLHVTKDIAQTIREICDNGYNRDSERQLLSVFVSNNITIKEIEEYKSKYSTVYNNRLRQLIADCKEFNQMGIKDKDILIKSFRTQALDSIYELPDIDIENLFVEQDLTIDDRLVNQYGFDSINVYLSYYNKIGSVVNVGIGDYNRNVFEKMSQNGLALQGKNIPIKDVLASQTLKTLNQIADNPEKTYKRKDQAIEYILSNDEKISSIDDYVAFSELFELIPLKDLSEKAAAQILNLWDYYETEIRLLLHTFSNSVYGWEKNKNRSEILRKITTSYTISSTNERCRCAKERMKTKYPLDKMPKTPCHIGCSCWINYN